MTQNRPDFLPEQPADDTEPNRPDDGEWVGKPLPDYDDDARRGFGYVSLTLLMLLAFLVPVMIVIGVIAFDPQLAEDIIDPDREGNVLTLTAGAAQLEQTRNALDTLATERALDARSTDEALIIRAEQLDAIATRRSDENIMTLTGIARANEALAIQRLHEIDSTRAVLNLVETQVVLTLQSVQTVGAQNATATARVITATPSP